MSATTLQVRPLEGLAESPLDTIVRWIGEHTVLETDEGEAVFLHSEDCPSFCDFACNDGRPTLDFVAVGFAVVRHERVAAFLYGLGIDIAESVVYLVLYDGL